MAGRISLKVLGKEVGLDLDEMLVMLWDCGLEQYEDPSETIAGAELKQVLRALGLPAYRELRSSEYWSKRLGIPPQRLSEILTAAGYKWRPGSRALPVGAPWALKGIERGGLKTTKATAPCAKPVVRPQHFEWCEVGALHEQMRYLTLEEVLGIRAQIAKEFAKSPDPFMETGTYSANLLESAISRPRTSLGAQMKYPTVEMAAAALLHSLVLNHPFLDGNKRTALVSMLVFLDENGFLLTCGDDDLFRFVLQVAKHGLVRAEGPHRADIECLEAAKWIHRNGRQIEQGERPMKWIKLRRLLRSYGCEFRSPRVGNRINIQRRVPRTAFLGLVKRQEVLQIQVYYGGDGTEADKNTVAAIRREMCLDETHGYDSRIFYDDDAHAVNDFIQLYRKTLQRLSRL